MAPQTNSTPHAAVTNRHSIAAATAISRSSIRSPGGVWYPLLSTWPGLSVGLKSISYRRKQRLHSKRLAQIKAFGSFKIILVLSITRHLDHN